MTRSLAVRVVGSWAVILVAAILNGALREKILVPALGPFVAMAASGLILASVILLVAFLVVPKLGSLSARGYWLVGLSWLTMTLVFEFGFGVFVQHKPIGELLRAYTFNDGNLWPFVLATTLFAPRLAAQIRGELRR